MKESVQVDQEVVRYELGLKGSLLAYFKDGEYVYTDSYELTALGKWIVKILEQNANL